MNDNEYPTVEDVRQILRGAAESITAPMPGVTKATAPAYHRHLQDIPTDLLRVAVDMCIENNSQFFPGISSIRDAAKELIRLSLGIPSAGEMWAELQKGSTRFDAVYCEESLRIRDGSESEYWKNVFALNAHEESCEICKPAHSRDVFNHPATQFVVEHLGGREVIMTGNPVADRSRFMDAAKVIIDREVSRATLSPTIKGYLSESKSKLLLDSNVSKLAKRMSI